MDYEYRGLMAEAWEVLRGDTSGWADRAYYWDVVCQHGGPVLDIGCGTGRLLLDFLGQGVDTDGVDNSPEMLAICATRGAAAGLSPVTFLQEMEALDLPRKYQVILVPSSSLQLVIDIEARDEALRRIRAHLLPGGVVTASFMTLWKDGEPLESTWGTRATRESDGAEFRRAAYSRFDPETECESTRDRYSLLRDGEVVVEEQHERSPATRSYTQAQARDAFVRAGFTDVVLKSEFTHEPVRVEDRLFTVTASG